jgi:tetratricopeptide (TPR) repeat protein
MNDESNPSSPLNPQEDALKQALDELIQVRSSRAETPYGDDETGAPAGTVEPCPELGAWLELFGGEAVEADAVGTAKHSNAANLTAAPTLDALLAHAAECPACAERLRTTFADASPQESLEVANLSSSSPDWQGKLAAQLAATPRLTLYPVQRNRAAGKTPAVRRPRHFYLWAGVGLAASLLLAVALTAWWRLANTPEQMLAEAYTHDRIFDLRIPGAAFADVTPEAHLRGGATVSEPARLQEARADIERHLESAPEDPHWLQLEARSDVLEEKFDPAIDILDRLLAAGPVTSGLLLDDASAYFQRGVATGSENDRATALERLRHADELAPDDPVVLFNEAVVMEDRGQAMNAVETWNRFLHFERDARWLADGHRRLHALELKLNQLKTHQGGLE